jgi:hypothetical protein
MNEQYPSVFRAISPPCYLPSPSETSNEPPRHLRPSHVLYDLWEHWPTRQLYASRREPEGEGWPVTGYVGPRPLEDERWFSDHSLLIEF